MKKKERIECFCRLSKIVEEKGITFYKIAKDLGFAQSLFSDWKKGKSMPKTDKLLKLADYLSVPIERIL